MARELDLFEGFPSDDALLRLVGPGDDPATVPEIGTVLASPNVPREFHTGFDPYAPQIDAFSREFFDRLIYISTADLVTYSDKATELRDQIRLLGRQMDGDDTCGCASTSDGTSVYQIKFAGDTATFVRLPGRYTIVAGVFEDPVLPDGSGPMIIKEYWMARSDTDERKVLIDHPAFKAAVLRHVPCEARRLRLRAHLNRLRSLSPTDMDRLFKV